MAPEAVSELKALAQQRYPDIWQLAIRTMRYGGLPAVTVLRELLKDEDDGNARMSSIPWAPWGPLPKMPCPTCGALDDPEKDVREAAAAAIKAIER